MSIELMDKTTEYIEYHQGTGMARSLIIEVLKQAVVWNGFDDVLQCLQDITTNAITRTPVDDDYEVEALKATKAILEKAKQDIADAWA